MPEGVPVIRGNNLTKDLTRFLDTGFVFLTEEKAREFRNCEAVPGDLVFTAAGTLGQVGIIPDCPTYSRYIISNKQLRARLDQRRVLPLFAFYWLSSPRMVEYIEQRNTGSTVPLINLGVLRSLPIPLPPLGEQTEIVTVLGTLDDKIELNRRMNQTLEGIARALFTSWFVDFDPVRAKAEGRQPEGMDAETAALFPSEFEESDLGAIPKGWQLRRLDQIATFLNGLALQKYPPTESSWLPVIKIAQLRKGNVDGADRASANLPPGYVIEDGDVLFSWSGSLEVVIWGAGRGALNQHLFKVTSSATPKWFYYLWTKHHLPWFQEIARGKATTMGHIQRHHLSEAKVSVPPGELMNGMSKIMSPLIEHQAVNHFQFRTLSTLRDTLLPRLLSGELRVPVADALVAATL